MNQISRRTFVKGAGAATGAAIVGGGSVSLDNGPVQDSEAIAPLVFAGAVGLSAAVGWALRETEAVGSDPPPEGLTLDALKADIKQTVQARKSNNKSTFVDNNNIAEGIGNSAYTNAKIAAIEKLNQGETKANVKTAGTEAIRSRELTVKKNLLKSWEESVNEFKSILSKAEQHPNYTANASTIYTYDDGDSSSTFYPTIEAPTSREITPEGDTFDLQAIYHKDEGGTSYRWDGTGVRTSGSWSNESITIEGIEYLRGADWGSVYNPIDTAFTDVRNGITLWVDNIYSQVQSGEIEISDLLTPREQANLKSDGSGYPQAVADLIALNVPMDLERKMTITTTPNQETITISGTLGATDQPTIKSGNTYTPSNLSGDLYFTYDVADGTGTWTEYQTAIDGGTLTLTKAPYESLTYEVTTTAGETVTVKSSDFTDNGDGTYSVDLSSNLETNITEVDTITFTSQTDGTQYETILLDSQFTVESIKNEETGTTVSSTSYTKSEPQTDTNYISQEEWDQLEQKNQELIEKYEESQNSGGGAGGGFFDGGGNRTKLLAVGGAALALVFGLGGSE